MKTRLGADIGMVGAAWWFRHQCAALLRRLRDPRWDLVLAVSPDIEGLNSRVWPGELKRFGQGMGDLGLRMGRLFRELPPGPVCIIGADIPRVSRGHVARAFALLGSKEAVFGPAPDGGYWLVGMKRVRAVPPDLFSAVRWSTENALADSMASMRGLRVGLVDELHDVDTVDDLCCLREPPAAVFLEQ